jgi:hypothetical protein
MKLSISEPLWVKSDTDLCMMLLSIYENRFNERCTLLKGVNTFLVYFVHFTSNLDIIKRSAHNSLLIINMHFMKIYGVKVRHK